MTEWGHLPFMHWLIQYLRRLPKAWEICGMSSIKTVIPVLTVFTLSAFGLLTKASASPDYVTAWPKQVLVEKPDPILGNKPYWEFWVHSDAFAKRFKRTPQQNANQELKDGLQAMVLRIFKKNFWQELNPQYPQQYACEVDVYFDNATELPLSESGKPRHIFPAYSAGVSESSKRLDPIDERDAKAIQTSQPAPSNMKVQPLIFSDRPLDGRYSVFSVREYRPTLVPGLAVITLMSDYECTVAAPLQDGGVHWLSLNGERPYSRGKDGRYSTLWSGARGLYNSNIQSIFAPGPNPESKGYFRVPEVFAREVLPKVTLVKVLNWCIQKKHAHANPVGKPMPPELWQQIADRCEEAEQRGRILPDPQYDFGKETLQITGY